MNAAVQHGSKTGTRTEGDHHPVVALLGTTATGKSSVAMAVAERTGAAIVNCDALQVYRGLDIGTAKPSLEDQERVPHYLYDIRAPTERFSAGEYSAEAGDVLRRVTRSRPVLLVGGTGLYYRTLTRGIASIPPIAATVREQLRCEVEDSGQQATFARLQALDPAMAERLHASDTQRVQRALEVVIGTGKSQADWIAEQIPPKPPWSLTPFLLTLKRSLLYDRIRVRTLDMFERHWIEEVRRLLGGGVPASAPAFQAIGYRHIIEVLEGRLSETEAVEQTLAGTRRYAKRQATWFRKEPGLRPLDADVPEIAIERLIESIFSHSFSSGGSQ